MNNKDYYWVPRSLYFKNGKFVGTFNLGTESHDEVHYMHLPTDHYDFCGPINLRNKTYQEILDSIIEWKKENES
jgi:hypothetical protein